MILRHRNLNNYKKHAFIHVYVYKKACFCSRITTYSNLKIKIKNLWLSKKINYIGIRKRIKNPGEQTPG